MTKIDVNLQPDERVLWQDKPKFAPFVLGRIIVAIVVGILISAFFFLMVFPIDKLMFILAMSIPLIMILRPLIRGLLVYRKTEYLITDKRVITQTRATGRTSGMNTMFFNLEKIQEVSIKLGFSDRISKTGSIYVTTPGQTFVGPSWLPGSSMFNQPTISSIRSPYKVLKLLEQAIQDAKKSRF